MAEIEARNDAHDLAAINDRHMAIAPALHQPQRSDRRPARRHRVGITCHDFRQFRPGCAFPFGQNAVNGITPGEDAQ
jgi:hypothetical protein